MKNELNTVKLTIENKMGSIQSSFQKIGNDSQNEGGKKNPQVDAVKFNKKTRI